MQLEKLIKTKITGIDPVNELPIDADIWREAHGQHTKHARLHASSMHRDGIVFGLEVVLHPTDPSKLILAPGMAVDSVGRVLVVTRPQDFVISDRGVFYLVAQYSDTRDPAYKLDIEGASFKYRIIEGCQVERTKDLPTEPYIELARVERAKPDKPLRAATDEFDPAPDELNLLYRRKAFPFCAADGVVGELAYVPASEKASWKPHRAGLVALLNQANLQGFHVSFVGPVPPAQLASVQPMLLYAAGSGGMGEFDVAKVDALRSYLSEGGLLLLEADAPGSEFHKAAAALAAKLKAKPQKVVSGDPILSSHFHFALPPKGASPKGVLEVDDEIGVVISSLGYGSLWRPSSTEDPNAARELSRAAAEMGMNIIAFGEQRRRRIQLQKMIAGASDGSS